MVYGSLVGTIVYTSMCILCKCIDLLNCIYINYWHVLAGIAIYFDGIIMIYYIIQYYFFITKVPSTYFMVKCYAYRRKIKYIINYYRVMRLYIIYRYFLLSYYLYIGIWYIRYPS